MRQRLMLRRTASAPHLTLGLVITTTKRTYYLQCQSLKRSPIRVVRWHYPQETVEKPRRVKEPGGIVKLLTLLPSP